MTYSLPVAPVWLAVHRGGYVAPVLRGDTPGSSKGPATLQRIQRAALRTHAPPTEQLCYFSGLVVSCKAS